MIQVGGYDILSPFGQLKIMLVDRTLFAGEEETEEEHNLGPSTILALPASSEQPANLSGDATLQATPTAAPKSSSDADLDLEPNFDDVASVTEACNFSSKAPYDPWVLIDNKKVHKATVLCLYSNPLVASDSKDQLKQVCGFSQYNKTIIGVPTANVPSGNLNKVDNVICL
jgi:hypothetical protein